MIGVLSASAHILYMTPMEDHVTNGRLSVLSRAAIRDNGSQPTEREWQHLRECKVCQHVLEMFAGLFGKPRQNQELPRSDAK